MLTCTQMCVSKHGVEGWNFATSSYFNWQSSQNRTSNQPTVVVAEHNFISGCKTYSRTLVYISRFTMTTHNLN